jgi:hypothetical protein
MSDRNLYATVTNTTGIININLDASYSQISSVATIECDATTLSLGDTVTIDMGYADDHGVCFRGYVKKIDYQKPEQTLRITAYDTLVRAVDFFLASDNPSEPLTYHDIGTQALIRDLLSQCGITNVVTESAGFTWGTNEEGAKFNLQSVADAVSFICSIVGFTIYDDGTGEIHFEKRYPYVNGSDTPSFTITDGASGNIITCQYSRGTDKTRNKIVVYGKGDLHGSGRADNSYLVVDQTAVIAHELLDSSEIISGTISVNLQILNRLTESYEVEIEGDWSIIPRMIASLTETFSETSARSVFVYRVSQNLSSSGFITSLTLTP